MQCYWNYRYFWRTCSFGYRIISYENFPQFAYRTSIILLKQSERNRRPQSENHLTIERSFRCKWIFTFSATSILIRPSFFVSEIERLHYPWFPLAMSVLQVFFCLVGFHPFDSLKRYLGKGLRWTLRLKNVMIWIKM